MVTASDVPLFREWKLERFEDVSAIDKDQMDKALHFLTHAIRKCRILDRALVSMIYHEQGRIKLEMRDNVTGEIIYEPKPEVVEDDPLS